MNKKQSTTNDAPAKPAGRAEKTTVEDLQPRPERAIQGGAGKVAVHDIPIIMNIN